MQRYLLGEHIENVLQTALKAEDMSSSAKEFATSMAPLKLFVHDHSRMGVSLVDNAVTSSYLPSNALTTVVISQDKGLMTI